MGSVTEQIALPAFERCGIDYCGVAGGSDAGDEIEQVIVGRAGDVRVINAARESRPAASAPTITTSAVYR